jgi:hypothetical protein
LTDAVTLDRMVVDEHKVSSAKPISSAIERMFSILSFQLTRHVTKSSGVNKRLRG